MRPKACSLSQCRNGIIMEENRALIQFNYPNCIMNVKEEIVCIPKKKVSHSSPSTPLGTYPGSTWSPADYNGVFCAQKTCKVCSLQITQLPLKSFFVLHDWSLSGCIHPPGKLLHLQLLAGIFAINKNPIEKNKPLLGRGKTFAKYMSTIIKFSLSLAKTSLGTSK